MYVPVTPVTIYHYDIRLLFNWPIFPWLTPGQAKKVSKDLLSEILQAGCHSCHTINQPTQPMVTNTEGRSHNHQSIMYSSRCIHCVSKTFTVFAFRNKLTKSDVDRFQ